MKGDNNYLTVVSKPVKKRNDNLLLAKYSSVGYYLVTPLLVGVFFGLSMDAYFHTKPIFLIVFLIIGVTGVFYNLYKVIKDAAHKY